MLYVYSHFATRCEYYSGEDHGFVFSHRPLRTNERLYLQIIECDLRSPGSVSFGLTTCDPSFLSAKDLPEDPDELQFRPEFWKIMKDVVKDPESGAEMSFQVTETGKVLFFRNRQPPVILTHVNSNKKYFAFFDLSGSTTKLKVLGES